MNSTLSTSDTARQDATMQDTATVVSTDMPRQDATRQYSLTLDEVAARFERAGLPRSMRTLQRYCASGRLDCLKTDTITGEQYFVDLHSVDRAITELQQLSALTHRAAPMGDTPRPDTTDRVSSPRVDGANTMPTSSDAPRHDATRPAMSELSTQHEPKSEARDMPRQSPPASSMSRHDAPQAAPDTYMTRYVERVESENIFLREQVDRKDQQIKSLLERDKETNFLVGGLQRMLAPLLGRGGQSSDREPKFDA